MGTSAIAMAGVAALAGAALWATPAAADGATTAYTDDGGHAVYYEGGGVTNNVRIEQGEDHTQFVINDQVPIAVGDGCAHPYPEDATYVVCTLTEFGDFWTGVYVDLGEDSDRLWLRAGNENGVSGGPGNDSLDVTSNTVVNGDGGNDWMLGGWLIHGGAGDDSMQRFASGSLAYGDDGNDYFFGNSHGTSFFGGRGNDTIEAMAGADVVYGNSGRDRILGGRGNDDLYGGPGGDVIYGNSGNDLLRGGSGIDQLSGGPGTDSVRQG